MENTKQMYGVEYFNQRTEHSNFDIFETIEKAKEFVKSDKFKSTFILFFIFKADFKTEYLYQSEDGTWNYFNYPDLFQNQEDILLPKDFFE